LDEFIGLLKTTTPDLTKILVRKWMISAIEAVFSEKGFAAQGVLVIQGEQGTHKTTFIKSLVDPLLNAVKTGQLLDPSNKDSVLESSNYWIVELGELDSTFRKADIARLKAHITRDMDELRRAYARKSSHMARRTVFAATVNESRFFVDETGNRRWWVLSLTEAINTRHGLDMKAIWREVYELWQAGENSELDKETLALLNKENEQYSFLDPFEEKLDHHFYWDREPCQWLGATQVLDEIGYDKPTKADLKRMGDILAKRKLNKGTGRRRCSYHMPQRRPYNYIDNND
jgi:putative DNA primase/helicase